MNNSKDLPEKIYREYEPKIRQYVRSHVGNETDAEDVLANIFSFSKSPEWRFRRRCDRYPQ